MRAFESKRHKKIWFGRFIGTDARANHFAPAGSKHCSRSLARTWSAFDSRCDDSKQFCRIAGHQAIHFLSAPRCASTQWKIIHASELAVLSWWTYQDFKLGTNDDSASIFLRFIFGFNQHVVRFIRK